MKVALIGACDRNNYGDLLMPIVFEKQYRQKYPNNKIDFNCYGQVDSNMSYLKSYNTSALHKAYNNCDVAVMVGGEILSSNFKLMYFNLQTNLIKIFLMRCFNKVFPTKMEEFSKRKLHGRSDRPWILNKEILGCKKLIYNTVGGNFGESEKLKNQIKNADYLAIRNKVDFQRISNYASNSVLYPDSVVCLSKVFTEEEINNNVNSSIKKMCKDNYFVIQIDKRDGKKLVKELANQINATCEKLNLNCILLPIGYAQGHEDQVVLKKILKICNNRRVHMPNLCNIYETLYIIKNAELFVGTSLHGIVTATSYYVPHMALTTRIPKVLNYIDSWDSTPIKYTEIEELEQNIDKLLSIVNLKDDLKRKADKIIELAEENFNNINNIINGELK